MCCLIASYFRSLYGISSGRLSVIHCVLFDVLYIVILCPTDKIMLKITLRLNSPNSVNYKIGITNNVRLIVGPSISVVVYQRELIIRLILALPLN